MIYHRYISSKNKQIGAYRNTGKGWQKMDKTYHPLHHISADGNSDLGVRFVDVDHDGLEDMIYHRYLRKEHHQSGVFRNTITENRRYGTEFNGRPHDVSPSPTQRQVGRLSTTCKVERQLGRASGKP